MMKVRPLLEEALEQAVRQHFCKLFEVMMADATNPEAALERFRVGVRRLAETEQVVSKMIAQD